MVSRLIERFSGKPKIARFPFQVDFHSHLLPGIDDGAKTAEESHVMIQQLQKLGLSTFITTPHIMADTYPNTPAIILQSLEEFKVTMNEPGIISAAAEYYLDERFVQRLDQEEQMLTFGDRLLLFETNFMSEPLNLNEVIFKMTLNGYRPILAHPERYQYMTLKKAEDLRNRGVLLQLNSLSLIGYYGKPIEKLAGQLVEQKWIDALGSDCHNPLQASLLGQALQNRYLRKALDLPLLNYTLSTE